MSSLPLRRSIWASGAPNPARTAISSASSSFSSQRVLPSYYHAATRAAVRSKNTTTTTRSISQSAYRQATQSARASSASNSAANPSTSTSTSTTPSPSQPSPTARAASIASSPPPTHPTTDNIQKTGLSDKPLELEVSPEEKVDWTRSFHGLSAEPFPKEVADILLAPTDPAEVEIKPDGIVYLPEIKYRRILNRAFGPGGWGLVPRSESIVTPKTVTREYALVCNGRYVSPTYPKKDPLPSSLRKAPS